MSQPRARRPRRARIASAAALVVALALPVLAHSMNIDAFWEYSDPAASEARFRAALPQGTADERLELLTQIARTYSLRNQSAEAHSILDAVEPQLAAAGPAPRVRYLLERGRTWRSAGDPARAVPLFVDAWKRGQAAGLEGLAVDAAHMLAIVEQGPAAAEWTARGAALARASSDPKARALLPALLNNHAWNLYDAGRFADALVEFRAAEAAWHATGRQPQGRIATWSVARTLRALGRHAEALQLQQALEREWAAAGAVDGYVFEEIAENLEALGRRSEATGYFRRAGAELAKDADFARQEPARWERINALAARTG